MSDSIQPILTIEKAVKGKVKGYDQWDSIPLTKDVVRIGRPSNKPGAIQPDIKILGDACISRQHAEITYSSAEGCFILIDTESTYGTLLNDEILESNQPYPLKDNDRIGLAKVSGEPRIVFKFKDSEGTKRSVSVDKGVKQSRKGWYFNRSARKVSLNGQEITLSKKEFKVLEVLYNEKGRACEIDTIIWEVWGEKGANAERVTKYISILRNKINDDAVNPRYIKTVPGGHSCYMLVD